MSRPKREPTPEELAIIAKMRSEYWRTLKEIQPRLAEQIGNPPSIGLLHRWVTERKEQESRELAARLTARGKAAR